MNGKSYSLPPVLLKKYHCARCGARLEKERTHRVVTPVDPDYYRYHNRGKFPRGNYDVYEYRLMCPDCGERVSLQEQRIRSRIQKKQGSLVLSESQLQGGYAGERTASRRAQLLPRLLGAGALAVGAGVLFYLSDTGKISQDVRGVISAMFAVALILVIRAIKLSRSA